RAGIHDRCVARLTEATAAMRVGNGFEDGVGQGPLIDDKAVAFMEELVADAVENGGTIALGGKRHALGGNFFEPTIITNASEAMRVSRDEIFGPVAPIFRFETEEEVIRLANATEYGLACAFYTADLGRSFRVMRELESGIVG